MGTCNLGNVVGPIFPVVAVAALVDDLGVNGLLDFTDLIGQLSLLSHLTFSIIFTPLLTNAVLPFASLAVTGARGFLGLLLNLVGDGDDFHFAWV
ncbi:hypothetical protein D3C76_661460 [compost metagenome]